MNLSLTYGWPSMIARLVNVSLASSEKDKSDSRKVSIIDRCLNHSYSLFSTFNAGPQEVFSGTSPAVPVSSGMEHGVVLKVRFPRIYFSYFHIVTYIHNILH